MLIHAGKDEHIKVIVFLKKKKYQSNCCKCRLGLWPNNIDKYGNQKETQHNCISLGINRYISLQDFDSYYSPNFRKTL